MADSPKPPSPTVQDRLKAVVASTKGRVTLAMVSLPRFRPADVAMAKEFDDLVGELTAGQMGDLIELSAIAAVDKLATWGAVEMAKARKEHDLAAQKLRDQTDIAMQAQSNAIAESLIPMIKAKASA